MEVKIADKAGFCFGVERAIKIASEILDSHDNTKEKVYILGEIIHNPQTVEQLSKKGAITINVNSLKKFKPGKLILRSHGAPLEVIKEAKELGFEIIDTTCPFVKKAQVIAKENLTKNFDIFIIGKKEHPEVIGLMSHSRNIAKVIGNLEQAKKIPFSIDKKALVIVQTTFSQKVFKEIVGEIILKYKETLIFNTICDATYSRRQSSLRLAKEVDINIIVGGKNSSNTRELTNYLQDNGFRAMQIENIDELKSNFFDDLKKVGITGGASTPLWLIEKVKRKIEKF